MFAFSGYCKPLRTCGGLLTILSQRLRGSGDAYAKAVVSDVPGDQDTLIVPADVALVIGRLMGGRPVQLAEYANGRYRTSASCDKPCDLRLLPGG